MAGKKKKLKLKKVVALALIVVLSLMFICLVPDLLLNLHSYLKQVPILNRLTYESIDDKMYLEIILSLLLNCIAIIISVFALYTSQLYTKTQVLQQRERIIEASMYLEEIVENNMKVIYELQKNMGNIAEVSIDEKVKRDAAILYSADIISTDDLVFFTTFVNDISEIKNSHDLNHDKERDEQIEKFCEQYFKGKTVTYSKEIKHFLDCIKVT